jgi:Fur family peroxide stress response transcriptional regulator
MEQRQFSLSAQGKKITSTLVETLLRERNISPSVHRVKVLEYLLRLGQHPTAQDIYRDLNPQIPTLSKTTVYNVISLFKEKQLVRELRIEENEVRYDWQVEPHAHFKCTQCQRIINIEYDCPSMHIDEIDGHRIDVKQISFLGRCAACRETGEATASLN